MSRAYNFCAGPAALPEAVLQRAREEMLDYRGTGMSVMEMSHRDDVIVAMAEQAEKDLRDLMGISDDYAVLFLQGGASAQFAMVPMNLLGESGRADYVNTGQWSTKAIKEARRFGDINVAASSEDRNFSYVPAQSDWRLSDDAAYVHYCPNETIGGLEFDFVPEVDKPLVADMSSTILSRPLDVGRFGLIYAGAQKNIGPAGITVVIVRKDLLGRAGASVPAMMNYQTHAENGSMAQHAAHLRLVSGRPGVPVAPRRRAAWKPWASSTGARRRSCMASSTPAVSAATRWRPPSAVG